MTIKNAKIHGIQVDPEEYHRFVPIYGDELSVTRGKEHYIMSRSSLMEFNHCPHRWIEGYKQEKTKALSYGQMLDAFVLDTARFNDSFIIQPETYVNDKGETKKWNNNSNTCKAWNAETLQSGKSIISEKDYSSCHEAQQVLFKDEIIKSILTTSDFQVMILAEWHDKETGLMIPIKCLIDIVPRRDSPYHQYLVDIKTCRSAAPGLWAREVYNYAYHVQAAFYLDMHEAATGEVRNAFAHILQESYEPFEPGRRMLSDEFIELGRDKYEEAIKKYCHCLKSGKFGGYDAYTHTLFDGLSCTEPEPWMISKQD